MHVIAIRHGEKLLKPSDPPLTPSGVQQAEQMGAWIQKQPTLRSLEENTELWHSPLLRTVQTAQGLTRAWFQETPPEGFQMLSKDLLLEQQPLEKLPDMQKRIEHTLKELQNSSAEFVILISHFDWLAHFFSVIPCDDPTVDQMRLIPTGGALFEIKNKIWHLRHRLPAPISGI